MMSELSTLARPYAKAAFSVAKDQSLNDWSTMLSGLKDLVSDTSVGTALKLPMLNAQEKSELLIELLGDTSNNEFNNFIKILGENNKLSLANEIAHQFEVLKREAENTLQAEIYTAMAIDEKRQKKISEALAKRTGKDVTLNINIQEDLIGGAIIKAGDLVIDGSITGQLSQLNRTLN